MPLLPVGALVSVKNFAYVNQESCPEYIQWRSTSECSTLCIALWCSCSTSMLCNLTVVCVCILCLLANGKECSFLPVILVQTQYLQQLHFMHCHRRCLVSEVISYTCKICLHVRNVSLCRSSTPSHALQKICEQKRCRRRESSS